MLVLLLLAGLAGWGIYRFTRLETKAFTLYFTDAQAMFLVPVTGERALPRDGVQALNQLLSELSRAPEGLQAVLPPGSRAEVQRISHGQANITVQLPSSLGSGAERLLAGAVVKTAASLGEVREVRLQLRDPEGNAYESQHLDLSTPLTATDPGVENLYLDGANEGLMVTLYYATPDGRYLVPLRRPLPSAYRTQPMEGSFRLLLSGPPEELAGVLGPSVPADPAIGWGGISQGSALIHWPASLGDPQERERRAIALTLTEFDGIRQVAFTREGQEIAALGRPTAVNRLAEPFDPFTSAAPVTSAP